MPKRRNVLAAVVSSLTALLGAGGVAAQPAEEVKNWPVPAATWTPSTAAPVPEAAMAESLPTEPAPFIGIAPCRLADTRRSDLPSGYGKPRMSAGQTRTFIMTGQPHCFIPPEARAISLNITVIYPTTTGYLSVYPTGLSKPPVVATLSFQKDSLVANAALVPLGADGGATVLVAIANADVAIDVNGYFGGAPPQLTWRGAWNSSIPYAAGDLVFHAGSSWVSQIAGNQGKAPAIGASAWSLLAQKGDPGPQGPAGSSPWQVNTGILSYNGGAVGLGTSTAPNPNNPNDYKVKLDIEDGNIQLDAERGFVTEAGARVVTGPDGGTFRFIAATPANDIAYFMDSTKTKKVAIDKSGGIQFGFQKVCSVLVGNTWRDTLLVPSTWTAATCDRLRSTLGASAYQLACIFENDFSIGQGSGIPARNCGW